METTEKRLINDHDYDEAMKFAPVYPREAQADLDESFSN